MATSINSSWKLGTKMTALVVDDDSINQTIHHRLLEQLGIENQVARNGKEAIDIHCSGKKFDLILMDRDMPVMNGIEVCRPYYLNQSAFSEIYTMFNSCK